MRSRYENPGITHPGVSISEARGVGTVNIVKNKNLITIVVFPIDTFYTVRTLHSKAE